MEPRKQTGFTLVELLIVVAIIGIIAAIAVPNLIKAVDRAKQKSTMANIKSLASAVEQYAIDINYYPLSTSMNPVDGQALVIEPHYIQKAPDKDGWSGDLYYGSNSVGSDYTVTSYGKDKKVSPGSAGTTTNFDCDIIYQTGSWVSHPEGLQT